MLKQLPEMSYLFYDSYFDQDISNWDVSNVEDMWEMFAYSKFNKDISSWKISKDCVTYGMFNNCPIKEEHKPKLMQK